MNVGPAEFVRLPVRVHDWKAQMPLYDQPPRISPIDSLQVLSGQLINVVEHQPMPNVDRSNRRDPDPGSVLLVV